MQEERQVLFPTTEELELNRQKRIVAHENMLKLAQENPVNDKIIGCIYGKIKLKLISKETHWVMLLVWQRNSWTQKLQKHFTGQLQTTP